MRCLMSDNSYEAIRRDLEHLLNSRCAINTWPNHCYHLKDSLLSYGLSHLKNKMQWCDQITTAINEHEKRLTDVVVRFEELAENQTTLTLIICATLKLNLRNQDLMFDADINPIAQRVCVKQTYQWSNK